MAEEQVCPLMALRQPAVKAKGEAPGGSRHPPRDRLRLLPAARHVDKTRLNDDSATHHSHSIWPSASRNRGRSLSCLRSGPGT